MPVGKTANEILVIDNRHHGQNSKGCAAATAIMEVGE